MPVYLLSGGLDSVVLLHWGVRQPHLLGVDPDPETGKIRNVAVHFHTGIAVDPDLSEICKYHCSLLDVELVEIELGWLWPPGTRARGEAPAGQESPIVSAVVPASDSFWREAYDYQDGRGIMFLTICGIMATNRGINTVLVSFQNEDDEEDLADDIDDPIALDVSYDFLKCYEELVSCGGFLAERAPMYVAPFVNQGMSKRHIVKLGYDLGVDLDRTLSCEFSNPPCGQCTGCTRRIRAFEQYRTLQMA